MSFTPVTLNFNGIIGWTFVLFDTHTTPDDIKTLVNNYMSSTGSSVRFDTILRNTHGIGWDVHVAQ